MIQSVEVLVDVHPKTARFAVAVQANSTHPAPSLAAGRSSLSSPGGLLRRGFHCLSGIDRSHQAPVGIATHTGQQDSLKERRTIGEANGLVRQGRGHGKSLSGRPRYRHPRWRRVSWR